MKQNEQNKLQQNKENKLKQNKTKLETNSIETTEKLNLNNRKNLTCITEINLKSMIPLLVYTW